MKQLLVLTLLIFLISCEYISQENLFQKANVNIVDAIGEQSFGKARALWLGKKRVTRAGNQEKQELIVFNAVEKDGIGQKENKNFPLEGVKKENIIEQKKIKEKKIQESIEKFSEIPEQIEVEKRTIQRIIEEESARRIVQEKQANLAKRAKQKEIQQKKVLESTEKWRLAEEKNKLKLARQKLAAQQSITKKVVTRTRAS